MQNAFLVLAVFMLVLTLLVKPVGLYMAPICKGSAPILFKSFDKKLMRLLGLENCSQTWSEYAGSLVCFNILGLIVLYLMQRFQAYLPLNPEGLGAVDSYTAFNTAISFVTNTNWQSYGGESTMGYFVQMAGLALQNFLSAATGIAVAFVLMRSLVAKQQVLLGNFFSDVVRISLYILLPLAFAYAIFLVSQGCIQNFSSYIDASTLSGVQQTIPMGPVASQEAIKMLGTNGGGFFNANSAHPFENPTDLSNFSQCLAIFVISAALCYTFGVIVNDSRQGWTIYIAMAIIFVTCASLMIVFESAQSPYLLDAGAAPDFYNTEGKEARFPLGQSALFSTVTTSASCGAVNNMHDSLNPLSGMLTMLLMQIGEVVFGGVGSGFYGIFIFIFLAVFISSLMIGRTPEYLGKKLTPAQMKLIAVAVLCTPFLVLAATAIACLFDFNLDSLNNTAAHGFSEYLYAFSSAANNNGSAFAGLNANTPFFNIATGLCMFFGRFIVIICILGCAGAIAKQKIIPSSSGTLPTFGLFFSFLIAGTVILIGALTFLPALALGPVVEHIEVFFN